MSILRSTQNSLNPPPDDTGSYLVYGISALSLLFAAALWPYIRSHYPCFTTSELTAKQKKINQVYDMALVTVSLVHFGDKLQEKAIRLTALKNRASRIRSRDLQMDKTSKSLWKIYLGFHPSIVLDIVAWYKDAEDLERDIQLLIESDTQRQSEAETATPTDAANHSNSPPHIVPVSSPGDTPPRRRHEGSSFVLRHRHRRPPSTMTASWTAAN
ncbi:hypothetical protein Moror_1291 [Moniliophthora roreri MCA 2997]|uniref:Uncharacterized protein n=2 Tax=Moniliophthora roreri TaxID=221103 RepID=V2WNQ6_MONRO|nr:hypothetical protein Moror_1291 [Moniliophthora roreri MCA 2997]KAI3601314.1 hypothetical protein WG66_013252 [Moniliophthora roreri]